MKKYFNLMLAAIIICGASVFTSCTVSDNPASPAEPDLGVAEKIIGRWITEEMGGRTMLTNQKVIYNFISTTECYFSASLNPTLDADAQWVYMTEADVAINGNKVTITHHPNENETLLEEYTITSINDNEFTANQHFKVIVDGNTLFEADDVVRFSKVKVDYSADIFGMWEGYSTGEEGSEFDDGENQRW